LRVLNSALAIAFPVIRSAWRSIFHSPDEIVLAVVET
jgi:hypothetical protein